MDRFRYVSPRGYEITFGENGIYANYNDLRDFAYSYNDNGGIITDFFKQPTEKTLPVVFIADRGKSCHEVRNRVYEIMDGDTKAGVQGRLYIGDWYISCNVIAMVNGGYLKRDRYCATTITILCPENVWRTELEVEIESSASTGWWRVNAKDYPYDYSYGYAPINSPDVIVNPFFDAPIRIVITGRADRVVIDPVITIDGNAYGVRCRIGAEERLTIDGVKKTVVKENADGTVANLFKDRDTSGYIFRKLKSGRSPIMTNGQFGYTLYILGERNEPVWN